MSSKRREFLKVCGLATAGIAASAISDLQARPGKITGHPRMPDDGWRFNMAGYAAEKMDRVRIGYIGLGNRGAEAVSRIVHIAGVDIRAICDTRRAPIDFVLNELKNTPYKLTVYTGSDEVWKQLCEREDIDLVYICTPWAWHTPMAVYAMQHGKHVAVEVPAAQTLEECWQLVNTSEKTRRHCVMLENECFDFFELLTLNMARQGFFGDIIHGEGAYIHNIARSLFDPVQRPGLWRLKENTHRNGNLYPTHGLGPVCQVMNINRGDRLEYMTSMSSADFTLGRIARELAQKDAAYTKYVDRPFEGNMNTSCIRTVRGKTIMLQHDVSSTRPKTARYLISGTKAIARLDAGVPQIAAGHEGWLAERQFENLQVQFTLPLVRKIGPAARKIGGHGGMDVLMDWRLIDCLRNGLPPDYNVYDAATWSAVVPLSESSVAHRSAAVDVPDFTRGSWKANKPIDLSIAHGSLTPVR